VRSNVNMVSNRGGLPPQTPARTIW